MGSFGYGDIEQRMTGKKRAAQQKDIARWRALLTNAWRTHRWRRNRSARHLGSVISTRVVAPLIVSRKIGPWYRHTYQTYWLLTYVTDWPWNPVRYYKRDIISSCILFSKNSLTKNSRKKICILQIFLIDLYLREGLEIG